MASSLFGRHATRIQPTPKVCLSKKAEQGPSRTEWGLAAAISWSVEGEAEAAYAKGAGLLLGSKVEGFTDWIGQGETTTGGIVNFVLSYMEMSGTMALIATLRRDGILIEAWVGAWIRPENTLSSVSELVELSPTVGSAKARIVATIA